MDGGFNQSYAGAPPGPERTYRCAFCGIVRSWSYTGDMPTRCRPCAQAHNRRINAEQTLVSSTRYATVLEAVDAQMHWAQDVGRWLVLEGDRWGRVTDNDAYTTLKQILRNQGADDGPEKVEAMLWLFRHHCENRAAKTTPEC